jgi:hypothetical protein
VAAWIISDLYGGELAVCEVELHVLLSDALARLPSDSSIRVEAGGLSRVPCMTGSEPPSQLGRDSYRPGVGRPGSRLLVRWPSDAPRHWMPGPAGAVRGRWHHRGE